MDFLPSEHAVIFTGLKNIEFDSPRLISQNQGISQHVHWVKNFVLLFSFRSVHFLKGTDTYFRISIM